MRSLARPALDLVRCPNSVAAICLLAALALQVGGCASQSAPVTISGSELLERSPVLAIDVENERGAVLVTVNPNVKTPRVTANAGTLRGEPVANFQGDKWASSDIQEMDGRAVLKVRSVPEEGAQHWVQITIDVPSCDGLRIKNSDGAIEVRGANGAISIENGGAGKPGGRVYVDAGKPNTSPISITTATGNIDLELPTDSTGDVELISGNRALAAMVAWTGQVTNSSIRPGLYTGILNWGTNPIRLKATQGEVRLQVGPFRFGNPQKRYYYQ
ncbi:MAG: hypothetical protein KF691_06455 [Phycisphaeraceae bacterium]|nr:hypothetical protein [Phycisphaeraceae bacterium]